MTLSFNIEYRTSWGEEVRVLGSIPELGNNESDKAIALSTIDGIHWSAKVGIQIPENGVIQYSYVRNGTVFPVRSRSQALQRRTIA